MKTYFNSPRNRWQVSLAGAILSLSSGCASLSDATQNRVETPDETTEQRQQHVPLSKTVANNREQKITPRPIELRPQHPSQYTVKKGDTLWDISAHFLKEPWLWPSIWHGNPQIKNPHLIYPGDNITLTYVNGQPRLVVNGRGGNKRLSPSVRHSALSSAIPLFRSESIAQFTARPRVITKEQMDAAPYVIGNFDNRLVSAMGHEIYARGIVDPNEALYSIYRRGKPFIDPESKAVLGHELTYVADAKIRGFGDPSTLVITRNNRETLKGDLLLPLDRGKAHQNYLPRVPEFEINGSIIALVDAISQVARNQIVVINRGLVHGLEVGDVVAVEQQGKKVYDKFSKAEDKWVTLPNTRKGTLLIFKTFEDVSYALVTRSDRPIQLHDQLSNL